MLLQHLLFMKLQFPKKRFSYAMRYEIPIADFEEMIGQGLWVGHRFMCNGQSLVLTAIGQAETKDHGCRVVPVKIEFNSSSDV